MQKSKGFWGLVGAIILAIGFVAYLFFGLGFGPVGVTEKDGQTLITYSGADLKEEKDGHIVWALKAEKIMVNPKTNEIFLTNMHGQFHEGDKVFLVDAKQGMVTKGREKIVMEGQVYGKTGPDIEFKGQDLVYTKANHRLSSTKAFYYRDGKTVITGDSLEGDTVLESIEAKGHVKLLKED